MATKGTKQTKPNKIWLGDRLVDEKDATLSVLDHGLLYGDGIFEGMRAYSGRVFRLAEHLDRLSDSAHSIHLKIPMTKKRLVEAIDKTLDANGITDGYLRLVVTRGIGTLGLDLHLCKNPQVIIIARSLSLYSEELYKTGMKIVTASTIRMPSSSVNPRIKSCNYLNNILAKFEGTLAGCEEVMILNHQGNVAECSGDNIFLVKRGKLYTPPADAGILEGVTRNVVLEIAEKLEVATSEKTLTRHDVYIADECFLTGTAAEVIPVTAVDGRVIGSGVAGPVTTKILEAYRKMVHE